jgi:hypothetical protein
MQWDEARKVWTAEIELKKGVSHIDFFSNHRRTLTYKSAKYPTYVSSPYTRIQLTRS